MLWACHWDAKQTLARKCEQLLLSCSEGTLNIPNISALEVLGLVVNSNIETRPLNLHQRPSNFCV
ncbi:hypothetical protein SAMN06265370_12140 [Puniceibacterium sediminis]|uniref:Uncharacterized protein n=1 Tax=Puniceibacterium sediminis TaxID=1608407 RepID=A0A238YZ60_9RHOB|nr:hypothetical protein SAMN06265370_12140 [Puniceibacterium sediminis]